MASSRVPERRVDGIDGLKGIAILFVIAIHVFGLFAHTAPDGRVVAVSPLLIGVPVFMAASVFFASRELSGGAGAVRRRLPRIVVPFLLWTGAYVLLAQALGGSIEAQLDRRSFVDVWLLGGAAGHLFFLPALVQVLVILPVLAWWMRRRSFLTVVASVLALAAIAIGASASTTIGMLTESRFVFVHLPSAAVAVAIATGQLRIGRPWMWVGAGGALVVAQSLLAFETGLTAEAGAYAKAGLPIAAAGCIAAASRWTRPPGWLTELGRRSLGVYLVHLAVLLVAWEAVGRHPFSTVALLVVPTTAAVAAASWLFTRLVEASPVHVLVDGRLRRRRSEEIGQSA